MSTFQYAAFFKGESGVFLLFLSVLVPDKDGNL